MSVSFRLLSVIIIMNYAVSSIIGLPREVAYPLLHVDDQLKLQDTQASIIKTDNTDTHFTETVSSVNQSTELSNENQETYPDNLQVDWKLGFLWFSVLLGFFMTCRYVFKGLTDTCFSNQQERRRQGNHRIIDYSPQRFDNVTRTIDFVVSQRVLMSHCKRCSEEINGAQIEVGNTCTEELPTPEAPPPLYELTVTSTNEFKDTAN